MVADGVSVTQQYWRAPWCPLVPPCPVLALFARWPPCEMAPSSPGQSREKGLPSNKPQLVSHSTLFSISNWSCKKQGLWGPRKP